MPQKILFVCTGNICRSPMAEGLLKKMALDHHWSLEVQSAGLAAFNGVPATPEAVEACQEKGINISAHQSQPLSKTLVLESTLILTMTDRHKESILRKMPQLADKVCLLSDFAGKGIEDVEDPMGQSIEVFRKILTQIEGYLLNSREKLQA